MKFIRSPLRITLGGGGTDLPSWYSQYGGFLISAAINKYIYLTGCERPFDQRFWLSYSKVENCASPDEVKHDLLAEVLKLYSLKNGIEIHSVSELPGSSGMGSSGSLLVAAITLLNSVKKIESSRQEIAELACKIEMEYLKRSSGKQDQYIAAFGGIISMDIDRKGNTKVENLDIDSRIVKKLENNILIYYSGITRDAESVLSDQKKQFSEGKVDVVECMKKIQEIGYHSKEALLSGKLDDFGYLLNDHWLLKKKMSQKMSVSKIDEVYDLALKNGALGGKIMGAGGGGFFMFYVPQTKQDCFRESFDKLHLIEMDWQFDHMGCTSVYSS